MSSNEKIETSSRVYHNKMDESETYIDHEFLQCCHPNATFKLVDHKDLYRGISLNEDKFSKCMRIQENSPDSCSNNDNVNQQFREKGPLLSKRRRTENMSDSNNLKNTNMIDYNALVSDDEEYHNDNENTKKESRNRRKRERNNSISAFGQVRRSGRLQKLAKHDHSQCSNMYDMSNICTTSGIESDCDHCKICAPCRNGLIGSIMQQASLENILQKDNEKDLDSQLNFKKFKLVHNGGCECADTAVSSFIPTDVESQDGHGSNNNYNGKNEKSLNETSFSIFVNEHFHCPGLFHQGTKSESYQNKQNRKRSAKCIDQNFKSVPTSGVKPCL